MAAPSPTVATVRNRPLVAPRSSVMALLPGPGAVAASGLPTHDAYGRPGVSDSRTSVDVAGQVEPDAAGDAPGDAVPEAARLQPGGVPRVPHVACLDEDLGHVREVGAGVVVGAQVARRVEVGDVQPRDRTVGPDHGGAEPDVVRDPARAESDAGERVAGHDH